jgi:hypothetical protein
MPTTKIRDLAPSSAGPVVYRRNSGAIFVRLDETSHVRLVQAGGGSWSSTGPPIAFDPDEEVEIVDLRVR